MLHLFRPEGSGKETRFIIKTAGELTEEQFQRLVWFVEDGGVSETAFLQDGNGMKVVEIGPPPQYATANSTNLTSIFHNMGIPQVVRAEEFKRCLVPEDQNQGVCGKQQKKLDRKMV